MQKLRVVWQDGAWVREGDQPVACALIPADVVARAVGDETLAFISSPSAEVHLAIPSSRLISAVRVDVESADA